MPLHGMAADDEMVLVDTGDQQREWTQSILDYYERLRRPKLKAVLLTHSHQDHIGSLDRIYDAMPAPVRCHPKLVERLAKMIGPDAVVPLKSREMIRTGGDVALQALLTPGHEVDHVAFYLKADRVLFTDDYILGASSSRVRDLFSYMKSLDLLLRYPHDTICPGHGPVVPPPRGAQLVRWYRIRAPRGSSRSMDRAVMVFQELVPLPAPGFLRVSRRS